MHLFVFTQTKCTNNGSIIALKKGYERAWDLPHLLLGLDTRHEAMVTKIANPRLGGSHVLSRHNLSEIGFNLSFEFRNLKA
jgi:hypothetical protein